MNRKSELHKIAKKSDTTRNMQPPPTYKTPTEFKKSFNATQTLVTKLLHGLSTAEQSFKSAESKMADGREEISELTEQVRVLSEGTQRSILSADYEQLNSRYEKLRASTENERKEMQKSQLNLRQLDAQRTELILQVRSESQRVRASPQLGGNSAAALLLGLRDAQQSLCEGFADVNKMTSHGEALLIGLELNADLLEKLGQNLERLLEAKSIIATQDSALNLDAVNPEQVPVLDVNPEVRIVESVNPGIVFEEEVVETVPIESEQVLAEGEQISIFLFSVP